MKTAPKAPQEMAAQLMGAYPYFSDTDMPLEHADHMDQQAKEVRAEVESMRPYLLTDNELASKLTDIQSRAYERGLWRADRGEGAAERVAYAEQVKKSGDTQTKKPQPPLLKTYKKTVIWMPSARSGETGSALLESP